jgi:hypothetical protein
MMETKREIDSARRLGGGGDYSSVGRVGLVMETKSGTETSLAWRLIPMETKSVRLVRRVVSSGSSSESDDYSKP